MRKFTNGFRRFVTSYFAWIPRLLPLVPIVVGLSILVILVWAYDSQANSQLIGIPLNPSKWPLIAESPAPIFAIVFSLLIANIFFLFSGTFLYSVDIVKMLRRYGNTKGSGGLILTLILTVASLFIILWWFHVFDLTETHAELHGESKEVITQRILSFASSSTHYSLMIFGIFAFCDLTYKLACEKMLRHLGDPTSERYNIVRGRRNYCDDSCWLIDLPGIFASVVLIILSIQLNSPPVGVDPGVHEPLRGAYLQAGFLTGSLICEIIFSQCILTVLNLGWVERANIEVPVFK